MTVPLLVSCKWLKENCNNENLVILDVSWSSSKDMGEEFKKGHIKGARYINVMNGENTELFPRNLPTAEKFQESVRAVGVNNNSHIVLYSNSDFCGYFLSGRAWWTFKYFGAKNVSILDGGWQKWNSENYPITTDDTPIKPGNFTVNVVENLKRNFTQTEDDVKNKTRQICDSRGAPKYKGPESTGHIQGAKNLPLYQLIDQTSQTLKPIEEIKKDFSSAGIDVSKPITTYCFSGMSSCSVLLAANLCGNMDASLYLGGFTEWSKKADKSMIEN